MPAIACTASPMQSRCSHHWLYYFTHALMHSLLIRLSLAVLLHQCTHEQSPDRFVTGCTTSPMHTCTVSWYSCHWLYYFTYTDMHSFLIQLPLALTLDLSTHAKTISDIAMFIMLCSTGSCCLVQSPCMQYLNMSSGDICMHILHLSLAICAHQTLDIVSATCCIRLGQHILDLSKLICVAYLSS